MHGNPSIPQSPFFPASSSSFFDRPNSFDTTFARHTRVTTPIDFFSTVNPRQTARIISVSANVTEKYNHTQFDTSGLVLRGSKFQNDALKSVATNVPGGKTSVMAVMTRMSAV